jgi:chromosome segregation ATPase
LGKSVLNHLAKKLENKKKEMPDKLIKIGLDSIDNLKQKISFLLNNLVEHYEADEESKEKKLGLQAKVRELVGEWEQRWQQWDLHSEQLSNSASAFPGGVGKTETEEEDSEIDSTEAVMAGFATANADVMDTVESFETA